MAVTTKQSSEEETLAEGGFGFADVGVDIGKLWVGTIPLFSRTTF